MSVRDLHTSRPARPHSWLTHLLHLVVLVVETRRDRLALSRLDPHLLRDIGLSPEEAEAEAARPMWDVPAYWHRRQPR